MTSIKDPKSLVFKENTYAFLKIHSIGYNDFKKNNTSNFLTTNVWNALYFVQSGTGNFSIRGNTYPLGAGSFFFITPNEPVKYYSDNNDPIRYYWISFYSILADEIREILDFTDEEPTHMAKAPEKVEWLFKSLLEAKSATSDVYFMTLSALMQILSTEFSKISVSKFSLRQETLVQNAKQLIDLNYTNPEFHIGTIAQMLYISHSHISRLFKEKTGITPVAYLSEVRLNNAANLLSTNFYTVKELCSAVGFVDEWHFMKCFKKRFGMTIQEYRKQYGIPQNGE